MVWRWEDFGGSCLDYNSLAKRASFSLSHQPIVTVIAMARNLVRMIERKAFVNTSRFKYFNPRIPSVLPYGKGNKDGIFAWYIFSLTCTYVDKNQSYQTEAFNKAEHSTIIIILEERSF
jgi:hypothetical protein